MALNQLEDNLLRVDDMIQFYWMIDDERLQLKKVIQNYQLKSTNK